MSLHGRLYEVAAVGSSATTVTLRSDPDRSCLSSRPMGASSLRARVRPPASGHRVCLCSSSLTSTPYTNSRRGAGPRMLQWSPSNSTVLPARWGSNLHRLSTSEIAIKAPDTRWGLTRAGACVASPVPGRCPHRSRTSPHESLRRRAVRKAERAVPLGPSPTCGLPPGKAHPARERGARRCLRLAEPVEPRLLLRLRSRSPRARVQSPHRLAAPRPLDRSGCSREGLLDKRPGERHRPASPSATPGSCG